MKKISIVGVCVALYVCSSVFAQTYTQELYDAYQYAHKYHITTAANAHMADMYGKLTRGHMAKMMVNYAKNVLGKKVTGQNPCGFVDIADQALDIQGYIVEACQMGLMGLAADGSMDTHFTPNGIVDRAQFGTVFSRVLRGDLFEWGVPYFQNHLTALSQWGIMKNIKNPYMPELRWRVMLMMMRAQEEGKESNTLMCNTQENIFYCDIMRALWVDICPQECVMLGSVSAGSLSIQPYQDLTYAASWTYVSSFRVEAKNSPIRFKGITFQIGTWWNNSTRVWLENNNRRITGRMLPTADNILKIEFSDILIKANNNEKFHIVSTTKIPSLSIKDSTNIESSALFILENFPLKIY